MKRIFYLSTPILLAAILGTAGCKDDDGTSQTIEEQQLAALNGTWTAVTVTQEDNPAPGDWSSFAVTFNSAQLSATFTNQPSETIVFADNSFSTSGSGITQFQVTIGSDPITAAFNANILTLSFTLEPDGIIGGRSKGIDGEWVFTLTK